MYITITPYMQKQLETFMLNNPTCRSLEHAAQLMMYIASLSLNKESK